MARLHKITDEGFEIVEHGGVLWDTLSLKQRILLLIFYAVHPDGMTYEELDRMYASTTLHNYSDEEMESYRARLVAQKQELLIAETN